MRADHHRHGAVGGGEGVDGTSERTNEQTNEMNGRKSYSIKS